MESATVRCRLAALMRPAYHAHDQNDCKKSQGGSCVSLQLPRRAWRKVRRGWSAR